MLHFVGAWVLGRVGLNLRLECFGGRMLPVLGFGGMPSLCAWSVFIIGM